MSQNRMLSLLAAACVSACYGYVTPSGSVEVTSAYIEPPAPAVEIESSPYVVYEGHPTYFYNNQWYYRDRDRWRYYRTEPPYLQQNRARVEREWRERQMQHEHPPGYQYPQYPQQPYPPQYPQQHPYPQQPYPQQYPQQQHPQQYQQQLPQRPEDRHEQPRHEEHEQER